MDLLPTGSISQLLANSGQLDEKSAQLLWDRFFDRLCRFASKRINERHRRHLDPEDVAGSAMYALMDGLNHDRFTSPQNRDQLWQLLALIASRKSINKAKFLDREKRGGKITRGDSVDSENGINNLAEYIDLSEDPARLVEFEMTCRELLAALPDDNFREISMLRLAGYSNREIAQKLNCSARTIDRKLLLVRQAWIQLGLDETD